MAHQISVERVTWTVSQQSLRFSAKSTGCLQWHVTDRKCLINCSNLLFDNISNSDIHMQRWLWRSEWSSNESRLGTRK